MMRAIHLGARPGALLLAHRLDDAEALAPLDHRDHQQGPVADREHQVNLLAVGMRVAHHDLRELLPLEDARGGLVVIDREELLLRLLAALGKRLDEAHVLMALRERDLVGVELSGDQVEGAVQVLAAPRVGEERELRGCANRPTALGIGTPVQCYIPAFWSNGLLGRMTSSRIDT
jgi:hypothetical protein